MAAAAVQLKTLPQTWLVAVSSHYRSQPVDATGPDYINAVVELRTDLEPEVLLAHLQRIEQAFGRERPYRHAPRTLDLDLLMFGERRVDSATLTLPHARLHMRAFVLAPLAELAPELRIADGRRVSDALAVLHDQAIQRIAE